MLVKASNWEEFSEASELFGAPGQIGHMLIRKEILDGDLVQRSL